MAEKNTASSSSQAPAKRKDEAHQKQNSAQVRPSSSVSVPAKDKKGGDSTAVGENVRKPEELTRKSFAADTESVEDVKEGKMPISAMAQKRAEVRTRKINWGAYLQSGIINQDQFDHIIMLDKYAGQKRAWVYRENPTIVAQYLFELLQRISKDDTVQYLLTLIDDSLHEDRTRVDGLHEYATSQDVRAWNLLMPFLNRQDLFIMHQTARIIAKCACWSDTLMEDQDLTMFLSFLKLLLRANNNEYREATARCLQMMLRIKEYRIAFVNGDGLSAIVNALNAYANYFQLQYQLIFGLWCISFDADLSAKFSAYNVIPVLSGVLANSLKEKVIRIAIATLRNLLEKPDDPEVTGDYAMHMAHTRVVRSLQLIHDRNFDDPEMAEDIEFLVKFLKEAADNVSSYDEYAAEVRSGNLEWSPPHRSEVFWRENAQKFGDGNYELLKILIHLMERSKDPMVVSVAVHDVGQYIRYYPRGKGVLDKLGGKERAMFLLSHEDPGVRYQALMALQKIMVHNWEFLGKAVNESKEGSSK